MSLIEESCNFSHSATSCISTPPIVSDQATSSSTPPGVSDQATSSSTPPGVSDQVTSSSILSNVSDQTTSTLTPPGVSDQAADCITQTSEISSVLHVESHEIPEYLQMVSADEYSSDLHVIHNDVDYLYRVDVNSHSTVNDEMNCNRLDDVGSHSEPGFQQQGYHPPIEDACAYEEITGDSLSYVQVAGINNNYEYSSYNEQNQAPTTNTSETSFNTIADSHQPQQVAVYELSSNDELTDVNNRKKRRRYLLLFLAAVSAVLLAYSAFISIVVNPTLRVVQASSPLQQLAHTIEAFGLMRTRQDAGIINGLLAFDCVIGNVSSTSVNLTSSSLTAPQTASSSLYWMIIAVEVPKQTPAHVRLANTNLTINKFHSKNSDKDIITKSGLVQLKPANVVTVRSDYAVNTAYWSGFCLNNMMQSVVAIFVASSKQLTYNQDFFGATKIAYDTVIINEGKAWDTKNDVFVVPQSGVYVFSISIGFTSPHNPTAKLGVRTWSQSQNVHICQAGMGRAISSDDVDFISASHVLHLVKDATVEGMFSRAESIYSDSATLATSMSAFLYSPASNKQVVWSVTKTTNKYLLLPFENLLSYDLVRLNIGGAWLPSQHAVVIATPGIYYVFVAMDVCDHKQATLWLRVNAEKLLEIKSTMSDVTGQTRSNGAVIQLAAGDKLSVEMADVSQTCLYISEYGINSFMGLLLTPASV